MCRYFYFNFYFEDHLLLHFHYPLEFHISWIPYSPSCSDQAPIGVLGCGWWKGEQFCTFSCSVYNVLQSLAYEHSTYKANTKCCQTYVILLNCLAVPKLSETLIAKAQGSSFAVSLGSAPRLQLDMPNFIWLFASSSQLLYEHFALFSHTCPCLSSTSFLTSTICKSFLQPTKGLIFSCQQTFFNLSLSQQTLLNPLANVLALKAVVCHYLLIPLLSLSCAWSCSLLPAAAVLSSAYVQSSLGHQHLPVCQNF